MTTLVTCSQHLGLMWVAVEAATLTTAPLIYFNRTPRSIEATWKYLLVGSVGIALALLGSFFLAYSSLGQDSSLLFRDLLARADQMNRSWLQVAFVLLLVGYGTKMGLAPMHTWKPDAYGEAPGVVGALLAGGLTSCAFLALVRVFHICQAAGEGAYASRLLVFFGLFSIAVAAVFMVGQRDFKRMLAYSSIEHMGILILGDRTGRARNLRFVAAHAEQWPHEGGAVPLRRQHPPRLRQQVDRRGARRDAQGASLGHALPARLLRDHAARRLSDPS